MLGMKNQVFVLTQTLFSESYYCNHMFARVRNKVEDSERFWYRAMPDFKI